MVELERSGVNKNGLGGSRMKKVGLEGSMMRKFGKKGVGWRKFKICVKKGVGGRRMC